MLPLFFVMLRPVRNLLQKYPPQLLGVACLILIGLLRPAAFLFAPDHLRLRILSYGMLTVFSPLPLVFDRPAFFDHKSLTLYSGEQTMHVNLKELMASHFWISWSVAYSHFFLQMPPDGREIRPRDAALARKLFCNPAIYFQAPGEISKVVLGMRVNFWDQVRDIEAEVICSGK